MAFDPSKPHGTALGGQTHGCFIQDGKTYRANGAEVDGATGKELKAAPAPAAKPAAKAAVATLSSGVATPLNTAIGDNNAKKWPEALAAVNTAQAAAKTDYEKMKVNQIKATVLAQSGDDANAVIAAEAAADTPAEAIPDDEKQQIYFLGAALALNAKHVDKAVTYAKQLIAINATDARSQEVIDKALYAAGDPGAPAYFQKQIDAANAAGKLPSRDSLQMLMAAQIKLKDETGAEKTMIQSVLYYNDKEDWKQIIDVVISTRGIRDIDAVLLGRLLFICGADVSKEDADLIGQTAQKAALYGDAQTAMSKGATLTLDPARIASDKASLPQQIQMGAGQNGLFNVKLAEALYGYAMYPEAEAAARLALTKGADSSEAQMLVGMALTMEGKYADAVAAFGQVTGGSPATPRIAELWTAYAKNKGGLVSGPATAAR